jgi:hypothetical protein
MEAASVSARDDATLEDASAGALLTTSAKNEVRRDARSGVLFLVLGAILAIYAVIGYAVYLMVAAIV